MASLQELNDQVFNSGSIWNVTAQLNKVQADTLGMLLHAGAYVAFACAAIQLFTVLFTVYRDKDTNLMDFLAPLILKIVLVGAVLNAVVYPAIVRYFFAAPADAVANMVTMAYIDSFLTHYQAVMSSIADSPNKIASLISATLDGSLISTLLAGLIFWAAAICAYVMPFIQGMIFLFVFYVGPICIAFSICDFTSSVFKSWVSLMLTVCWVGFFGSCSFLVVDSLDLLGKLSSAAGGEKPNVILTLIYGVVSLVLFCSAWPITTFFFSSLGDAPFMNPARAIMSGAAGVGTGLGAAGVGSMMLGGIGKVAGAGLSKVSKEGSWMKNLGDSMQKIGGTTVAGGQYVAEGTGVRMPRATFAGDGRSGRKSPNIPNAKGSTGTGSEDNAAADGKKGNIV